MDDEVPAGQDVHVALPLSLEKVPAWHLLHELWPVEAEYVPGAQAVQLVAPAFDDVDFPAGHF